MRYLLAAIAILIAFPALAQDGGGINWRSVRQRQWVCRDFGGCGYEWRWRRVRAEPRYYAAPRYERELDLYSYREERRHCDRMRRVVGDQHLTVDGAKKAANDAWAGAVRFHLGEKFMALDNARELSYTCSRSSIKEGGVTTLGQILNRCEIQAVPCEAPRTAPLPPPEDRDDR